MFQSLYNWTLRLANHRHAVRSMAAVSFAESSFFPIPPDVVLIPIVLQNRERAWWIATVCTIASVLGGIVGYLIGYALLETVGAWLIRVYGMGGGIEEFQTRFQEYGPWIILLKGLTPIPFKLVTIAAGIAQMNFGLFVLTATITRAFRFFLVAGLLKYFGAPVQAFIEKRLNLIGVLLVVAIVGGFLAVAYL